MIKYLVIGSAPYIADWYKKNGSKFHEANYKLIAINNAWSIDPENLSIWIHSTDYYRVAKNQPGEEMKIKLDNIERTTMTGFVKYEYQKRGSGTMILNVLTDLLNRSIMKGIPIEVCVAGCDCVYPESGPSHFYGESTKDPLRFGSDYLREEFERIMGFYQKEGVEIFNVGGQPETLLPFPRKEL